MNNGGISISAARRAELPAAIFWPAALLLDAALLLALSRAHWVLVGLIVLAIVAALLRRPVAAFALVMAGLPALQPISVALGDSRPVVFLALGLVVTSILLRLWQSIWEPRRLRPILELPKQPAWLFGLALGILMLLGLSWTPAPVYGGEKTQLYWMTNVLLLTSAMILLAREEGETGPPRTARLFLGTLLALQIGIALGAVWSFFAKYHPYQDRLTALGLNPIWVARHAGLGILVSLILRELRVLGRLRLWLLLALFGWVFVAAGSRGPTIGLAAALILWFLSPALSRPAYRRRLAQVSLFGLILFTLAAMELAGREHVAGQHVSNQIRLWLLKTAREALGGVSLLGLGPGGFVSLLGLPDHRWYPHNLLLEVLLENGLLGFLFLVGLLGSTFAAWRCWGRDLARRGEVGAEHVLRRGVGALFLFAVLCAQFSGDFPVNEWVWAFAGIMVAWVPRKPR